MNTCEHITIFIHHRKCGDSLIHEDAERGVERRISVNHCDVVKRPDVQLLQRLRQKRRFGDFRYLGEKMCIIISRNSVFIERKLNILSCTRWVNRTFSRRCSIPVVPELHQQLCDRGSQINECLGLISCVTGERLLGRTYKEFQEFEDPLVCQDVECVSR